WRARALCGWRASSCGSPRERPPSRRPGRMQVPSHTRLLAALPLRPLRLPPFARAVPVVFRKLSPHFCGAPPPPGRRIVHGVDPVALELGIAAALVLGLLCSLEAGYRLGRRAAGNEYAPSSGHVGA